MGRKTVTILLCLIFMVESLIPGFELSSLSSLPVLWSHYQTHKTLSPQTTFLDFLHLHYDADSKHAGQDQQHHQKLPFSKYHHTTQALQLLYNDFSPYGTVCYCFLRAIEEVFYSEHSSLLLIKAVWQPPRI